LLLLLSYAWWNHCCSVLVTPDLFSVFTVGWVRSHKHIGKTLGFSEMKIYKSEALPDAEPVET